MKVFVIGATGFIGSQVSRRLLAGGHEVLGFARSDDAAAKVDALGAEPARGDLEDLEQLCQIAATADATVFVPQLLQEQEYVTVEALLTSYQRTNKAFLFTSGTGVLGQRTMGEWSEDTFAEDDEFVPNKYLLRRRQTELLVRVAGQDGLRAMVIRPPAIWGNGYHPFIDNMLASVEKTGQVCYLGKGLNLYSHVNLDDLTDLYRRILESGQAGALYHAVGGELNNRSMAECVATQQGTTTRSLTAEEAFEVFGKFTTLITLGVSSRSRSPRAKKELGWTPATTDLAAAILAGELTGRERP
jgi:nucleoside-diphosphate-sugar epimerase